MQHVLVTGASRGLGRALALGISASGWTVSACATDPDAIRSLAKELGPEHLALTCEVTQPAVGALATRVLERIGPPDLFLNNAAVINRNALLWVVLPERGMPARHRRESQGRAWDDPGLAAGHGRERPRGGGEF